ncbi:MAG: carbohydrate ABC transporter permease [Clostridiales bacterium]|nr:carbohydrate ABC transporter permease [Clostridiales bacterium]HBM80233.1 ABC transporter permease [Clostridiaceae bacterium]
MKESKNDRIFGIFNIILLVIAALIIILPFYYVVIISFTDPTEYLAKQGFVFFLNKPSLASYKYLLSTSTFKRATSVNIFITIIGTMLSLIVTAAFAYGLSRKRLVGRRVLQFIVLITLIFDPGIIPNYLVVRNLKLIDNIWSLIIPTLTSGWYIILMKNFFDSMPTELEEAALIDGCTDAGVFFKIILPLSAAALSAFGLFFAVGYWNTFFKAILYINSPEKWPLQVLLQNMLIDSVTSEAGQEGGEMPPAETIKMAAVIISTLPILFVYPFLQKNFTKGILIGSVKG